MLRFKQVSVVSALALDKGLWSHLTGLLTRSWCLFMAQRAWKEEKKSLAWRYFYITSRLSYVRLRFEHTVKWRSDREVRFVTGGTLVKRNRLFLVLKSSLVGLRCFSVLSLHGLRKKKKMTAASPLNFSNVAPLVCNVKLCTFCLFNGHFMKHTEWMDSFCTALLMLIILIVCVGGIHPTTES